MNTTTDDNVNTSPNSSPEQIKNSTTDAGSPFSNDVIIGSSVGGACGFLIMIIIIVIVWRRCRRSRNGPPPVLFDPYAQMNNTNTDTSSPETVSDVPETSLPSSIPEDSRRPRHPRPDRRQSDLNSSKYYSDSYERPWPWTIQEPVIHSPETALDDNRVSYFTMSEPSRPMSISPPSPTCIEGIGNQFMEQRLVPVPCKSPAGYVNTRKQQSHSSPEKRRDQSRESPSSSNDPGTPGDEGPHEDYTNVSFLRKIWKPPVHVKQAENTPVSQASHFNFDIDTGVPTSPTHSDDLYLNYSVKTLAEAVSNHQSLSPPNNRGQSIELSSSSDDPDTPNYVFSDDKFTHEDYTNIQDTFIPPKTFNEDAPAPHASHVDFNILLSEEPASPTNSDDLYQNVPAKTPEVCDFPTRKPTCPHPGDSSGDDDVLETSDNQGSSDDYVNVHGYKKATPGQQLLDDGLHGAVLPGSRDGISEHTPLPCAKPPCVLPKPKSAKQKCPPKPPLKPSAIHNAMNSICDSGLDNDTWTAAGPKFLGLDKPILASLQENLRITGKGDGGEIKSSAKDKGVNPPPTPTKILIPDSKSGETATKIRNQVKGGNSNTHKDNVSVHPNYKKISNSEPKLASRLNGVTDTGRKLTNTQSETVIIGQGLGGKHGKVDNTIFVQQPDIPTGASRSPLQKTHFGIGQNVGTSDSILKEIKSKLKLVN